MTPTELEDRLLSYAEAAKVLGVCPRTTWALVKDGSIPSVKIAGRTVRIKLSRLREWIDAQESRQSSEATNRHCLTNRNHGVS